MSHFSSALFISSSLALFSLGAPLAFAQPTLAATSTDTVSQISASAMYPATSQTRTVQTAANDCFTQDLTPGDDSSMLTICGAGGPSKVIFAP